MKSISKNYLLIVYYCIRHASIVLAIESAAAGSIAFWVGMKISSAYGLTQTASGGLWCAISVFMVICAEEKRTLVLGLNRVVAVFIGVVISGAIISGLGAGIASLLISLLICVIIVSLLRKKTCYRSVSITVAIIYLFRYMVPQLNIWWICLGRFSESVTGIIIAFIFLAAFIPVRRWLASIRKKYNIKDMEPF